MVVSDNIEEIEETTIKDEKESIEIENQEKEILENVENEEVQQKIEEEKFIDREENEIKQTEEEFQGIVYQEKSKEKQIRVTPKEHILKKENFETGLEIQFTSLNLNSFPIKDSNISKNSIIIDTISLGHQDIKIGKNGLRNTQIKIYVYERFKLLEIKSREFKIAVGVYLNEDNTLYEKDGYFSYEISNNLNIKRLKAVIEILKNIFSGEIISFEIKKMKAWINTENRIQLHKFILLEKSIEQYEENCKLLDVEFRVENLYEIESFYSNYLLNNYLKGIKNIESWINLKLENINDIIVGDSIILEDNHIFNFKNLKLSFKEKIKLRNKIIQNDIKNEVLSCYRKTIDIEIERI